MELPGENNHRHLFMGHYHRVYPEILYTRQKFGPWPTGWLMARGVDSPSFYFEVPREGLIRQQISRALFPHIKLLPICRYKIQQYMEYNTTRNHLIMREYGRHIQKMVEYLLSIKDKEETAKRLCRDRIDGF